MSACWNTHVVTLGQGPVAATSEHGTWTIRKVRCCHTQTFCNGCTRDAKGVRIIPVDAICWLEAYGNYVKLHCGPEKVLMRATMRHFIEHLDPRLFVQVHRGAVVNIARIVSRKAAPSGDAVIQLEGGKRLRVSRLYRPTLDIRIGCERNAAAQVPRDM